MDKAKEKDAAEKANKQQQAAAVDGGGDGVGSTDSAAVLAELA